MGRLSPTADSPPLGSAPCDLFAWIAGRLPARWVATQRRRRLLFLALAAPGFFAVFGTALHRNLFVAILGLVLFGAAALFRMRTEPLFEPASTAAADPNPDPSTATPPETRHA